MQVEDQKRRLSSLYRNTNERSGNICCYFYTRRPQSSETLVIQRWERQREGQGKKPAVSTFFDEAGCTTLKTTIKPRACRQALLNVRVVSTYYKVITISTKRQEWVKFQIHRSQCSGDGCTKQQLVRSLALVKHKTFSIDNEIATRSASCMISKNARRSLQPRNQSHLLITISPQIPSFQNGMHVDKNRRIDIWWGSHTSNK